MKRKLSVITMMVVLIIVCCIQTVTSTAAKSKVAHSRWNSLSASGNVICVATEDGLIAYNKKSKKQTKLSEQTDVSRMLVYKNYLYYTVENDDSYITYRIKVTGGSEQVILSDSGFDFIKGNRIYYYKNGICSASLDGSDAVTHYSAEEGTSGSTMPYVCYLNNRYYYVGNDSSLVFSVNDQFTDKKKHNKNKFFKLWEKAFDYSMGVSSLHCNGKWYYSDEGIVCGKKKIYSASKKYCEIAGGTDGYILIKEGNKIKNKSYSDIGERAEAITGAYKIINLKGKVIATLK